MRRSTDLIGDSDDSLRVNASVSAADWTHLQGTKGERVAVAGPDERNADEAGADGRI